MGLEHFSHNEVIPSETSSSSSVPTKEMQSLPTVEPAPPHAEHGALVDHTIPQDEVAQASPDLLWSRCRHFLREPLAEFFGVFILIMFGDGVVAQVVLSKGEKGDYQSISWGWGLGVGTPPRRQMRILTSTRSC